MKIHIVLICTTIFISLTLGEIDTCILAAPVEKGGADPGALIEVTFSGTVGILLTDVPDGNERKQVATYLLSRPDSWWLTRAHYQIHFTDYTLEYRNWAGPNMGQLALPDESLWQVNISSRPAVRIPWKGPGKGTNSYPALDSIVKEYTFRTVIVTDYFSPEKSDVALSNIGGLVLETLYVPLDPYLVIQRTGTACVDEFQYAFNSWNTADSTAMFDPTCTTQSKKPKNSDDYDCYYCHCTPPYPELDCIDSLNKNTGMTILSMNFSRIAWDDTIANNFTYLPFGSMDEDANIIPYTIDAVQTSVFEYYDYIAADSNIINDHCVTGYGWRKLMMFSATDLNNGKIPIHIGEIPYRQNSNKPPPTFILGNQYYWDPAHGHYHLGYYMDTEYQSKNGVRTANATKRGFCLITVKRVINSVDTPLYTPYFTCTYQGVSPGWADTYQIGIPCQWKDVTGIPAGYGTLSNYINKWDVLCEGKIQCDVSTQELLYQPAMYEGSQLSQCSPVSGECRTMNKFLCNHSVGENHYMDDNYEEFQVLHRDCGLTYVTDTTSPYGYGQEIGSLKNSEFVLYGPQVRRTNQTSFVTLSCNLTTKGGVSEIIRVCESSIALGCGTGCKWENSLANSVIYPGTNNFKISFNRPPARDAIEVGGAYSIYLSFMYTPLAPKGKTPFTVCQEV